MVRTTLLTLGLLLASLAGGCDSDGVAPLETTPVGGDAGMDEVGSSTQPLSVRLPPPRGGEVVYCSETPFCYECGNRDAPMCCFMNDPCIVVWHSDP